MKLHASARPVVLACRPEFRLVVESLRPTPVDQRLTYGERLDLAYGVRVIFTLGHTQATRASTWSGARR